MSSKIQSNLAHYYRFALIGSTSSGKTCLLAKLAEGRDANSRFGSCNVPLGDFMPDMTDTTDQSKWSEDRQLQENFRIGEERIDAAIERFSNQQRPEATSNDGARPMMRFMLRDTEQRGEFYVWTEDYAGELLNKEGLTDPKSQSSRLKNNLLKYDGLIIVVEAAKSEAEMATVQKQINTLNDFFTALADEEKREGRQYNIPVAIVVTKWDRVSTNISFTKPEEERNRLESFLQAHPFYEKIITAISANAMDLPVEQNQNCPTSIIRGNTAVFPVSAFGKSRQDADGHDFPVDSASFCLIEPFYWLASKCDEIYTAELEQGVANQKFYNPVGFCSLHQKTQQLKRFMSSANICQTRFLQARNSLYLKFVECVLTWVAAFYLIMAGWNQFHCRNLEIAMKRPETTVETYAKLKEDFIRYKKKVYYSWLFFAGKKRVDKDIQYIEDAVDKTRWTPTGDSARNAEMAKTYLESFPNGKHAEEASKLVQEFQIQREETAWENVKKFPELRDKAAAAQKYLDEFDSNEHHAKYERDAKRLVEQHAIQVEKDAWELVKKAPTESDDQKKLAEDYLAKFDKDGRARYRTEAWELIHKAESRAAWEKDLMAYNHECTGKDCKKILAKLQELVSKHGDRCEPLVKKLPDLIMEKLNEKSRTSDISDMITECGSVSTAVSSLERQLRGKGKSSMASVVMGINPKINALKADSIKKYDQALYQTVRSSRTVAKCQEYLNKMDKLGGGAMSREVTRFKDYAEKLNGKFDEVAISASIDWTNAVHDSYHDETVRIGGVTYINANCNPPSAGGYKSLGSHTFSGLGLSDSISVSAYLVTRGNSYNWNGVVWCDESKSYTLSSLLGGKEIPFYLNGRQFGSITVKASIPGLNEPELPQWHD